MEKFIPYEKLSKKEQRKIDQARRQTWGELNPVTRKPENSKAYNRRRAQVWKEELSYLCSSFLFGFRNLILHPLYKFIFRYEHSFSKGCFFIALMPQG